MMPSAYIEVLAHINCPKCNQYFSLSDVKEDEILGQMFNCPNFHCGYAFTVENINYNDRFKENQDG